MKISGRTPGVRARQADERGSRLLVNWTYDRSRARLGRGGRRVALIAAVHRHQGVTLIWRAPAGHRGGERLKSASVCQAMAAESLLIFEDVSIDDVGEASFESSSGFCWGLSFVDLA